MPIKDKKIGLIGLGTMGAPMAGNIKNAGFDLGVYNRTESRAESFRDEGATVYYAPWELAEDCDVIIIMVTGPSDLLEVVGSIADVLKSGKTVINMTTVSEQATLQAAQTVDSQGADFLDAPVSGSKKPAEDGTLVILAGGKEKLIDETEPLLLSMGKKVVRCGEIGAGTKMKLMINMLLANMMGAYAEALTFGRKLGLDFESVNETISSGALGCPLFAIKGNSIARDDYSKNFSIDLIFKDINLALEAGGISGIALPVTSAVREMFSGAEGMGLGDEDMAAVAKYYQKTADIKIVDGGK
ncbi:MAG: NAD-binding protein [candidate division Zixibacteria bacterium]|nr:NAD-binding protein [candidate division Zixibacteria bacterium]